jgi:hypothetical protein
MYELGAAALQEIARQSAVERQRHAEQYRIGRLILRERKSRRR